MEKRQVVVVHGGDAFDSYDDYLHFLKKWQIDFDEYRNPSGSWKSNLGLSLGDQYEVIKPNMPCKINAKYAEWKIWFDKFIPHLSKEVILIGHSLGGTFLVKYLSENRFPKKIKALFLVAAPFESTPEESLADFTLPKKLNLQTENTMIYHSADDQVVPFDHLNKYSLAIPKATIKKFADRGHFNQEEFVEIVNDIKEIK